MKHPVLFLIAALVLLGQNLKAQTDSLQIINNEFRNYIRQELKSSKATGISVAVVSGDSLIMAEGFGMADAENKIPANARTVFRVGSVSKILTATAVMQLSDRGLVNIQEPVKNYLPNFNIKRKYPGETRIHSLLTHHSGLPSDIFKDFFTHDSIPITDIIDLLNNEYTVQPEGFMHAYSNPAYTLLGCLVQEVSQKDYKEYMKTELFEPLEMEHSSFLLNEKNKQLYAQGYNKKGAYNEAQLRDLPAGMLHTNARDMANFMIMMLNNGQFKEKTILKPETVKEMFSPQHPDNPMNLNSRYGLGWFLSSENSRWEAAGGKADHGGDTHVFHAQMSLLPDQKIGMFVVTNSLRGASAVRKIADEGLVKYSRFLNSAKIPDAQASDIQLDKKQAIDFEEIEGEYVVSGGYMPIYQKGRFPATKQSGINLQFVPNNQGSFTPRIKLLWLFGIPIKAQQMTFKTIADKKYVVFINENDSSIIGSSVQPENISEIWQARCGKYLPIEKPSGPEVIPNLSMTLEDGFLKMNIGKSILAPGISFLLLPENENEAVVAGIGRQSGYTVKFIDKKLHLSGILFEKQD